jgi:rhomboid protease GluP
MSQPPGLPPPHRPMPRALLALAGFIALVEILLSIADSGYLGGPDLRGRVFMAGAFWAPLLHGAEPIFALQPVTMFLTHALLHGSLLHMAMNLAILLGLGRFAADRYGDGTVLPVFALTAAAGGAVFGLLSDDPYPMVGASGAVFGFLGVWIAWDWRRHRAAGLPVGPVGRRIVALAAVNVVFFFGLQGMLAWEAHLGGFLGGLALGFWLERGLALQARRARAEARRPRL